MELTRFVFAFSIIALLGGVTPLGIIFFLFILYVLGIML